jgi:hypothetical protein
MSFWWPLRAAQSHLQAWPIHDTPDRSQHPSSACHLLTAAGTAVTAGTGVVTAAVTAAITTAVTAAGKAAVTACAPVVAMSAVYTCCCAVIVGHDASNAPATLVRSATRMGLLPRAAVLCAAPLTLANMANRRSEKCCSSQFGHSESLNSYQNDVGSAALMRRPTLMGCPSSSASKASSAGCATWLYRATSWPTGWHTATNSLRCGVCSSALNTAQAPWLRCSRGVQQL